MLGRLMFVCLALAIPAGAMAQYAAYPVASPAITSAIILKDGSGYLRGANVTTTTAGYVLIFDSATIPADGAVTPARCIPLAANTGIDINFRSAPVKFYRGITVVFSSTGCFTKTASATAFIAGDVE